MPIRNYAPKVRLWFLSAGFAWSTILTVIRCGGRWAKNMKTSKDFRVIKAYPHVARRFMSPSKAFAPRAVSQDHSPDITSHLA